MSIPGGDNEDCVCILNVDWDVFELENDKDESFLEDVDSVQTDVDLEYDSEDNFYIDEIILKPKGFKAGVSSSFEMGEDSKALLFWRVEQSFSDWKIKVVAEKQDGGNDIAIYSVHRLTLTRGPKKCGYFEGLLLQSGNFREHSDCTSTIKLPEDIAKHFPDFLDYLYSQAFESKFIINFNNWKSMRYLANYFIVPRLTKELTEFVEKDMDNCNLEHIEDYIKEFTRDVADEMSRKFLPKATHLCAELILSIEADSSLLKSIPPRMLHKILENVGPECLCGSSLGKDIHLFSLVVAYLEQCDKVDELLFSRMFCAWLCWYLKCMTECKEVKEESLISRTKLALRWFQLKKQKGWGEDRLHGAFVTQTKEKCLYIIQQHLSSKTPPTLALMERIVKEAPSDVVAEAVMTLITSRGEKEDDESGV